MAYEFKAGSRAAQIVARVKTAKNLTTTDLTEEFECSRQYIHSVLRQAGMKAASPVRVWLPRKAAPPPKARVVPSAHARPISHSMVGSVSELLVAADLMARGWSVFFPLYRARADLIATSKDGRKVLRFEVRSARRVEGKVVFGRKPTDECDHYALALADEPVLYEPELAAH